MKSTINWGIVGLGNIANSFARDLALVKDATLSAVASRNTEKAHEFAAEYGVQKSFGSYGELFDFSEIDVVYIATPHTSHAELAIQAMNAGKHVLCEKPMGVNAAEVEQMVSASVENKVFLMEALWSRFNPSIQKAKWLIDSNAIGPVRYLHADFSFYALDRKEDGRLLNPELAGGSILDIGIYPIFLAYLLLGYPEEIAAFSNFHSTGVEIQSALSFRYREAMAILYSGLNSKSAMKAEISGTGGAIYLHPRWHETQGLTLEKEGTVKEFKLPTTGKGYSHEIEEVHRCLRAGLYQSELWSHTHSLELIRIMDEVRRQCGISFPFEN